MTKVVNFEDFEKEIEFTEMCFTNYRHIRYKFYGLFEFIESIINDSFMGNDLLDIIFDEDEENNIEFKFEMYNLTKEFFLNMKNCFDEADFNEEYEKYTSGICDLYYEYIYEENEEENNE